jgi:hypothetical protein
MASLRRLPNSPFWIACFTLPDGRRPNRSTGTHDRRQAQRIAAQYEDAAREARQGRFIEARARKAIADIFALANPDKLASSTIEDFEETRRGSLVLNPAWLCVGKSMKEQTLCDYQLNCF